MQVTHSLPAAQHALNTAAAAVRARLERDWAWVQQQFDQLDLNAPDADRRLRTLELRREALLEQADLLTACENIGPAAEAAVQDADHLAHYWHGQYVREVKQAAVFAGLALAADARPVPTLAEAAATAGRPHLPGMVGRIQTFINQLTERRKAA